MNTDWSEISTFCVCAPSSDRESVPMIPVFVMGEVGHSVLEHIVSQPYGFLASDSGGKQTAQKTRTPTDLFGSNIMASIVFTGEDAGSVHRAILVAQEARSRGALAIGVALVSDPSNETPRIRELAQEFDTLLVQQSSNEDVNIVSKAATALPRILACRGFMGVDPKDVFALFGNGDIGTGAYGKATGANKVKEAMTSAISQLSNRYLLSEARHIAIEFTLGDEDTLEDVNQAVCVLEDSCHLDANIICQCYDGRAENAEAEVVIISAGYNLSTRVDRP